MASTEDPADVLPAHCVPDVAGARDRAGRQDWGAWSYPIVGRHIIGRPWWSRRWAWYVAVPFGDGHQRLGGVELPGTYVEFAGRTWTRRGAHRAYRRAAQRVLLDDITAPVLGIDRARGWIMVACLGAFVVGIVLGIAALTGPTPWRYVAGALLIAAAAWRLDLYLGDVKRRRHLNL